MKLTAISVAWVFAVAFYAAGAIGFIPNPLLGSHGLFMANPAHNIFHLLTGVGFTVVALAGSRASIVFMQAFGVLYLLIGVIGFLATEPGGHGNLLGLVHLNTLDNFLHLGLRCRDRSCRLVLTHSVGFRAAFVGDSTGPKNQTSMAHLVRKATGVVRIQLPS